MMNKVELRHSIGKIRFDVNCVVDLIEKQSKLTSQIEDLQKDILGQILALEEELEDTKEESPQDIYLIYKRGIMCKFT